MSYLTKYHFAGVWICRALMAVDHRLILEAHGDDIKWKHFHLLALCEGNPSVIVISAYKVQWRGALMFSLICAWTSVSANHRDVGDLRRHRDHYDTTVVISNCHSPWWSCDMEIYSAFLSHLRNHRCVLLKWPVIGNLNFLLLPNLTYCETNSRYTSNLRRPDKHVSSLQYSHYNGWHQLFLWWRQQMETLSA